jgi:ribosomal protein S18 acetylase RimI-like enzyme
VTVRPATRADLDAVLALWGTSRTGHAVTEDTPEAVARTIAAGHLFVAEDGGGAIVGALIAAFDGWRGNMYRLAVAEPHRRRGIASALVRAGEERLRALGCPRVTALIAAEDGGAVALWESAGYARDDVIARWVRDL